jgi:hypothetical protein
VLKWALLGNESVKVTTVPVFFNDIENLIKARIPIFVDKPEAATVTLPLLLALEGPSGNFLPQSFSSILLTSHLSPLLLFITDLVVRYNLSTKGLERVSTSGQ